MAKTYVVALDGSAGAWKALDMATQLAKLSAAELVLIHVVPEQPLSPQLEQWAESEGLTKSELRSRLHQHRVVFHHDQSVSVGQQRVETIDQADDVGKMQSGRGFVQDK